MAACCKNVIHMHDMCLISQHHACSHQLIGLKNTLNRIQYQPIDFHAGVDPDPQVFWNIHNSQ